MSCHTHTDLRKWQHNSGEVFVCHGVKLLATPFQTVCVSRLTWDFQHGKNPLDFHYRPEEYSGIIADREGSGSARIDRGMKQGNVRGCRFVPGPDRLPHKVGCSTPGMRECVDVVWAYCCGYSGEQIANFDKYSLAQNSKLHLSQSRGLGRNNSAGLHLVRI
jgi:hypothetical protein